MESVLGRGKSWNIMWKVAENEQLCIINLQPDMQFFDTPKCVWRPGSNGPAGRVYTIFYRTNCNTQSLKVMRNRLECSV